MLPHHRKLTLSQFPPAPVLIRRGCGPELLICIGLLFLGWIPGVIYAWYIIVTYPSFRQRRRRRRNSVACVPREEVVYAGPRRSNSRRRSGGHGYEGTAQPYYQNGGWGGGGGQTGYYAPPPPAYPMSEPRRRKY
jgi:uncharacterized membrane protein YqaE (UPF0057 family)